MQSELALALAWSKDEAPAGALRTLVSVARAVFQTRTLAASVGALPAGWLAVAFMPVFCAVLLARLAVPLLSTGVRIVAAVLPFRPLDLKPRPFAGSQVLEGLGVDELAAHLGRVVRESTDLEVWSP